MSGIGQSSFAALHRTTTKFYRCGVLTPIGMRKTRAQLGFPNNHTTIVEP